MGNTIKHIFNMLLTQYFWQRPKSYQEKMKSQGYYFTVLLTTIEKSF